MFQHPQFKLSLIVAQGIKELTKKWNDTVDLDPNNYNPWCYRYDAKGCADPIRHFNITCIHIKGAWTLYINGCILRVKYRRFFVYTVPFWLLDLYWILIKLLSVVLIRSQSVVKPIWTVFCVSWFGCSQIHPWFYSRFVIADLANNIC